MQHNLTDGSRSIVGSKASIISKIRSESIAMYINTKYLSIFHWIFHQENLCAKSLELEHVMSKLILSITFIKYQALYYRCFQEFLEDIETEYRDFAYCSEVRWLSKGVVMNRFYDLRSENFTFIEIKGKSILEFSDDGWICDLVVLV